MNERPSYSKAFAQMSLAEYIEWSNRLRAWLDQRTRAEVLATGVNAEDRRVDPVGRVALQPKPPKIQKPWAGADPDYNKRKLKESRERRKKGCVDCGGELLPRKRRCEACEEVEIQRLYLANLEHNKIKRRARRLEAAS